jgi:thiamine-phosphate pyrophosphorylase
VCPLLPTRKPLLCYVTDRRSLADGFDRAGKLQLQKIGQAAKAGVDWIQLREKDLSGRELAAFAGQAISRAGSSSAILVNDRVDVACATCATGVHLGEQSLPAEEAKRLASQRFAKENFIVGVSAHSLEAAMQAEQAGADYVIFGPVYTTPTKASYGQPQGVQRLQEICKRLRIPVLAIGGITLVNAGDCFAAGAAGIAAIRLFQNAANLDDLVGKLRGISETC